MVLGILAAKLPQGAQGDDVVRVRQALQALGLSVSAADLSDRVMGAGTVAVIKALQAELHLSQTGVVDAATVR
jgi:peptidoglycan hydrolase-like protein with peptidoglycan-binding domain